MTMLRMTVAMLLAATAAVSAPAALACQITRTAWGLKLIDCNLSDFYKGRYDVVLEVTPNRPTLRLPNLQVSDIDGTLIGGVVQIDVEVENSGTLNVSSAFDVAVIGAVTNPLNAGAQVSTTPFAPASIAGLAFGASTARVVGSIALPNRKQDWDVCAVASVDPAVMGGSAWGSIFESNEMDNVRNRCCRVYGPNPNTNGPRAC